MTTQPTATGLLQSRQRWRRDLVLVPFIFLLVLWLLIFQSVGAFHTGPNGKTFGADFAMFDTAARLLCAGENPYDHTLLYRNENSWLQPQGLPVTGPKRSSVVRVGNPPLMFWALEPVSSLPFEPVAYAWIVSLALVALAGFLLSAAYLGWRPSILAAAIFAAMPQIFLGAYYGNVPALPFAGLAGALVLSRRSPYLAGTLLALVWVKPQVGLPMAILILLFAPPYRLRMAASFGVTSLCLLLLTIIVTGPDTFNHWIHALAGYSHDLGGQPDLTSLSGLYARWASAPLRLGLETAFLAVAAVLTLWVWWPLRRAKQIPFPSYAWLWVVWFLATPYAHFYDEIVLTLPILFLLRGNGVKVTQWRPMTTLYLLLFSLLLFGTTPLNMFWLWLPLLPVGVFLWQRRGEESVSTAHASSGRKTYSLPGQILHVLRICRT